MRKICSENRDHYKGRHAIIATRRMYPTRKFATEARIIELSSVCSSDKPGDALPLA
jgi:hypothetical protein